MSCQVYRPKYLAANELQHLSPDKHKHYMILYHKRHSAHNVWRGPVKNLSTSAHQNVWQTDAVNITDQMTAYWLRLPAPPISLQHTFTTESI